MLYWIPLCSRHAVQRTKDPPPPQQRARAHSTTTTSKQATSPSPQRCVHHCHCSTQTLFIHAPATMADEDEIAALVIDNGSGMCKGGYCQRLICNHLGGGGRGNLSSAGRIGGCVVSILPRRSIIIIRRRRRRPTTAHAWA